MRFILDFIGMIFINWLIITLIIYSNAYTKMFKELNFIEKFKVFHQGQTPVHLKCKRFNTLPP